MSHIPTGGPAFPIECNIVNGFRDDSGMTLRDWFAGQAVASGVINDDPGKKERAEMGISADASQLQIIAAVAYHLADAMLAEKFKADDINAQARKEEMGDDNPF
jgi:hypothetical protein